MRLTCPNCAASYEIPDRLIAGGTPRPVRCVRCGTIWTPAAPEATAPGAAPAPAAAAKPGAPESRLAEAAVPKSEAQAPAEPAGRVEAPRPLPGPPPRPPRRIEPPLTTPDEAGPRSGLVLLTAWMLSLALVGGGLVALWIWRDAVAEFWPPAARLFAALGG